MTKFLGILTFFLIGFSLVASAPSGSQNDISKEVTKNLTTYIIAGAVILCVIIALLCCTAAKGNFKINN